MEGYMEHFKMFVTCTIAVVLARNGIYAERAICYRLSVCPLHGCSVRNS